MEAVWADKAGIRVGSSSAQALQCFGPGRESYIVGTKLTIQNSQTSPCRRISVQYGMYPGSLSSVRDRRRSQDEHGCLWEDKAVSCRMSSSLSFPLSSPATSGPSERPASTNSCPSLCLLDEALDDKLTRQKEFLFDPSDPMKIRPEKLRPMARLGGLSYARSIQSVPSILHICP